MNKGWYAALLTATILAAAGGVATLIPFEGASYPNVLGYRSLCTFAPAASLFCFAAAGLSCLLRASLVKETSGTPGQRIARHFRSLVPIALVVLLALGSTVWFAAVKGSFVDASTAATEEAEE